MLRGLCALRGPGVDVSARRVAAGAVRAGAAGMDVRREADGGEGERDQHRVMPKQSQQSTVIELYVLSLEITHQTNTLQTHTHTHTHTHSQGNSRIALYGQNFGFDDALVFINGVPCNDVTHAEVNNSICDQGYATQSEALRIKNMCENCASGPFERNGMWYPCSESSSDGISPHTMLTCTLPSLQFSQARTQRRLHFRFGTLGQSLMRSPQFCLHKYILTLTCLAVHDGFYSLSASSFVVVNRRRVDSSVRTERQRGLARSGRCLHTIRSQL